MELDRLRKQIYFYIMDYVTNDPETYMNRYLNTEFHIWLSRAEQIKDTQPFAMHWLKSWVYFDEYARSEQALLTEYRKYPRQSFDERLLYDTPLGHDKFVYAYIIHHILGQEYLDEKLDEYREKSKHITQRQDARYKLQMIDEIKRVKNWWFNTSVRVAKTKDTRQIALTLRYITKDDLVVIIRKQYGNYYGEKIHDIIVACKELIDKTVDIVNVRVKAELANIDRYVNAKIDEIIDQNKGIVTQGSFIKRILIPADVDAWCKETTKDSTINVIRSQLWDILDRNKFKYGTKLVSEW